MFYYPVLWTDQGQRPANQDSVLVKVASTDDGQVALAVICDGCGGLSRGELASKQVVEHFDKWFEGRLPSLLHARRQSGLRGEIEKVLDDENEVLMRYAQRHGIQTGTTATVLLLGREGYHLVHIGDSRCYHIHDGKACQLTQDDTLAGEKMRQGLISHEEALRSRQGHILTRCIGAAGNPVFQYYSGKAGEGDGFLLCTDGFWRRAGEEDLIQIVSSGGSQAALVSAVDTLRGRKENDNITAALIMLSEVEHERPVEEKKS